MEIELPSNGCNVYYGTYLENFYRGTRSRYYFNNDNLILNSTTTYTYEPTGVNCVSTGDITYKPEHQVYFPFLASIVVVFALVLIYKVIIKRLMP